MKAKEYVAKYGDRISCKEFIGQKCSAEEMKNSQLNAISDLMVELNRECVDLQNKRGCKSSSAMLACYKEIEQKWRAIARQIKYPPEFSGEQVLQEDGLYKFWVSKMPEFAILWTDLDKFEKYHRRNFYRYGS